MKITTYGSLGKALECAMVRDIDHVLIRHSYQKGVNIVPHVHEHMDEYAIAQRGHFSINSEDVSREFNLTGDSVTVIYYPAGREHGLKVLGDRLDYFVLRAPVI